MRLEHSDGQSDSPHRHDACQPSAPKIAVLCFSTPMRPTIVEEGPNTLQQHVTFVLASCDPVKFQFAAKQADTLNTAGYDMPRIIISASSIVLCNIPLLKYTARGHLAGPSTQASETPPICIDLARLYTRHFPVPATRLNPQRLTRAVCEAMLVRRAP